MTLTTGMQAPDFSLFDTTKNKVNLIDLRGQSILLLFFPQAFTRVCTRELCMVRDNIGRYDHANAKVFGISVDSVFTLATYKEQQGYNFDLLSDFNKEISAGYGTLYDTWILEMRGVSKRSAFVIDKTGIIRYSEVLENASDEPNYAAIDKVLEEIS